MCLFQRCGETALILAAQRESLAVVQALLEAGSDVLAKDWEYGSAYQDKESALIHAIRGGNLAIVKALLVAGSDAVRIYIV